MVRSELRTKIGEGEETVGVIETLLILAVTAFHFAIVSWRIGTDQFVANPEACSRLLKKSWQVFFAVGETVGKLKAIVSLNALHPNAPAFEPDDHFFEEIRVLVEGVRMPCSITATRLSILRSTSFSSACKTGRRVFSLGTVKSYAQICLQTLAVNEVSRQ